MYEDFSLILTFCLALSARSGDGFKCRSRSPSWKPLRLFDDNVPTKDVHKSKLGDKMEEASR